MKYSSRYTTRYLKADDLLPTRRRRVTITEVAEEEMGVQRERKFVVYFEEVGKGLVLNKTNSATLARRFGDDTKDSIGKVIDLVIKPGSFEGKDIEVIRVEVPDDQPPPPRDPAGPRRGDATAAGGRRSNDDDIPFEA
jgi:hypothetical protein